MADIKDKLVTLDILKIAYDQAQANLQDAVTWLPDAFIQKYGQGLSSNDFTDELKTKLEKLSSSADVPGATQTSLGLVQGREGENQIIVKDDYTMEVYSLNVNKLTQTEGDKFILCGGSSAD